MYREIAMSFLSSNIPSILRNLTVPEYQACSLYAVNSLGFSVVGFVAGIGRLDLGFPV